MPERVVVIPMTCDGCGQRFEVHCAATAGFAAMQFYALDCPSCQRRHEKALPGDIVDVVIPRTGFSATCPRGHTMTSTYSEQARLALATQEGPIRLWCNYCGEHWVPADDAQQNIRRWARGEVK